MSGISRNPRANSILPWKRTHVAVQNNTDIELKKLTKVERLVSEAAPGTIPANKTGDFKDYNETDIGKVVYEVKNKEAQWIILWELSDANKAYTKIINPGEKIDWVVVIREFGNYRDNSSACNGVGLSASVVIDKFGDYPILTAVLGPYNPQPQ